MRILDLLIEATDYGQMFNDVFKLTNNPKVRENIGQNIDWARQTLKKNDRIIWFLRWYKVFLAHDLEAAHDLKAANLPPGQTANQIESAIGITAYNRRFKTNYTYANLYLPLQEVKGRLTHFMGTPIPEVQNYVFQTESPQEVLTGFDQWERTWRRRMEEEKSLITPLDEDEIVLEFPDGYAWWLLPRGGCDIEAKAMGHCGNMPSQRSGERILSLRRRVIKGDQERWYPVATFILDEDGMLGEMKGRNNDKPIEKYHPYIIALLRHDMIEGIKGGGYLPAHNFSMNDIDQETREQLFQEKPGLRDLFDFYESEGMTARVLELLRYKMSELSLPRYDDYDAENKEFILNTYRDLEDFTSTNGDDAVEKLLEFREKVEDAHNEAARIRLNTNILVDFLFELPDDAFHQIAASFGVDSTDGDSDRVVAKLLERNQGPIYDRIEQAFIQAGEQSDLLRSIDDRLNEYVENGWSFEAEHVYMQMEDPTSPWVGKVIIKMRESDLVNICSSSDDEYDDDDFGRDASVVAHSGSWDDVNWENTNENRKEQSLVKRTKSWNYVDSEFGDEYKREFTVENLADEAAIIFVNGGRVGAGSRYTTPTINDPRQMNMKFEGKLADLRRRAGIR